MSTIPETVIVEPLAAAPATETPLGRIARDFIANPVAIFGLVLLLLVVLAAILAPFISPQNPYDLAQLDVMDSRLEPGAKALNGGIYWLGTDDQGRDMLSAIFYGLRISLSVGVASTVLALIIGFQDPVTIAANSRASRLSSTPESRSASRAAMTANCAKRSM